MSKLLGAISVGMLACVSIPDVAAGGRVPITECGQVIDHGIGELTTDLECPASVEAAVGVTKGRLYLNGHSISGGESVHPGAGAWGVCAADMP